MYCKAQQLASCVETNYLESKVEINTLKQLHPSKQLQYKYKHN